MLNFLVFHHFGKLMVNQGFCAVRVTKTVLLSYGYILIIRKRIGCKDLSDKR